MAKTFGNIYEDGQKFTGGAVRNGTKGSQTPGSLQNASTYAKPKSDPYSSFGDLGQAWSQTITPLQQKGALQAYMNPAPVNRPPVVNTNGVQQGVTPTRLPQFWNTN